MIVSIKIYSMTSESAKKIFINEHAVKKFDIALNDFIFFKKFLEENITEEMVEFDRCDQISKSFPSFYLQSPKSRPFSPLNTESYG